MQIIVIYELEGIERKELWDTVGGQTDEEIKECFLKTFAPIRRLGVVVKGVERNVVHCA